MKKLVILGSIAAIILAVLAPILMVQKGHLENRVAELEEKLAQAEQKLTETEQRLIETEKGIELDQKNRDEDNAFIEKKEQRLEDLCRSLYTGQQPLTENGDQMNVEDARYEIASIIHTWFKCWMVCVPQRGIDLPDEMLGPVKNMLLMRGVIDGVAAIYSVRIGK